MKKPDCSCKKFLDTMGMSWYECMYGVVVMNMMKIANELREAKAEIERLKNDTK